MNSVSFNPSQKSPDGHKSLGRGGSFWLPPKMSTENFETNLKQLSKASSSPSNINLSTKSALPSGVELKSESFKGLHSQSYPQSSGKSSASVLSSPVTPGVISNPTLKSSTVNLRNVANLETAKPFLNTAIPSLFSNENFAVSTKSLPKNTPSIVQTSSPFLNYGSPKLEVLKKKSFGNDGTKSAVNLLNDNLFREFSKKPTNQTEFNQAGSLSFDHFSEKVSELLMDPPVLFASNQDVVRFAVTLDNGSSVSVRIENMNDSFSVCFVSQDLQVLRDLQINFSPKSSSIKEDQTPLNFYFFNSYSQMDLAFSKLNPHS